VEQLPIGTVEQRVSGMDEAAMYAASYLELYVIA
jgi:hypothetical protein